MSKDFLTDKEMEELQGKASNPDFISDADMEKMSNKPTVREYAGKPADISENFSPEELEVGTTTGEGLAAGFVKGVPFLQKGIAAAESLQETVVSEKGFDFDSFTKKYEENLLDQDKAMATAQTEAPVATTVGELGGAIGTGIAAGPSVATGVALGAVEGASQSRADNVIDYAGDVAGGALLGAAGEAAGYGLMKVGSKIVKSADKFLQDAGAKASLELFGFTKGKRARQALENHLETTSGVDNLRTYQDYIGNLERLTNKGNQSLSDITDNPHKIMTRLDVAEEETWNKMDEIYSKASKSGPKTAANDIDNLIRNEILNPLYKSDATSQEVAQTLDDWLFKTLNPIMEQKTVVKDGQRFSEPVRKLRGDMDAQQMHTFIKDLSAQVDNVFDALSEGRRVSSLSKQTKVRMLRSIKKLNKDNIKKAGDAIGDPKLLSELENLNIDYGDIKTAKKFVNDAANEAKQSDVMTNLRDGINKGIMDWRAALTITAGVGGATAAAGPVGGLAALVGIQLARSPKTPIWLAKKSGLLKEVLAKGERSLTGPTVDPVAKKAFNSIAAASALSTAEFNEHLKGILSETSLSQNKLDRDVRLISADQKEDIYNYLEYKDPSLLNTFEEALNSGNEDVLGNALDAMSKLPGADRFFKPGMGFNGKVYSDEDKMMLNKQVDEMLNANSVQKLQWKEGIKKGFIPRFKEMKQRQPRQAQKQPKFRKPY